VSWATGIHPFNFPLPFAQNENFSLEQIIKETWKYAKAPLRSRFTALRSGHKQGIYEKWLGSPLLQIFLPLVEKLRIHLTLYAIVKRQINLTKYTIIALIVVYFN
jgi:hypothetical protein